MNFLRTRKASEKESLKVYDEGIQEDGIHFDRAYKKAIARTRSEAQKFEGIRKDQLQARRAREVREKDRVKRIEATMVRAPRPAALCASHISFLSSLSRLFCFELALCIAQRACVNTCC